MLKVNAKAGEIFIDDVIGADWFGEGITARSVGDALEQLGGKRASIRINSPGGVADEGIAIYNLLQRYSGGVDTYNDSLAASAASIIFLAGENRTMSKGARVMIHRALTIDIGNATKLRKTAETLETYDNSLVEIYSDYLVDEPNILALMDAETWYSADEAITAGLATAKNARESDKPKVASWFKNAPANLVTEDLVSKKIASTYYGIDEQKMAARKMRTSLTK